MKHLFNICVVLLCLVSLSMATVNPNSRADNDGRRPTARITYNLQNQYQPAQRQNEVLFVEDKGGTFGPPISPDPVWDGILTDLLGTGNFGWYTINEDTTSGPDLATLQTYDLVIWNTYDYWWSPPAALTDTDQVNLGNYLLGGGKVWLIGQDLLWSGVPTSWMDTYFHLAGANQDYNAYAESTHVQGLEEISGFTMAVYPDYASNDFFSDELFPDTNWACHGVYEDTDSSKVVGIFYPGFGDWQTAFWSMDLRDSTLSNYWSEVLGMAGGMFTAFGITGINEIPFKDPVRSLELNVSPDPFVNTTTISFVVPNASHVSLVLYNRIGQYVVTLVNEHREEGTYSVHWNRRNERGLEVPNGVYFARLTCGDVASMANIVVTQ
jgi:hypothetical protein